VEQARTDRRQVKGVEIWRRGMDREMLAAGWWKILNLENA
jgi:hypothetical protein